MVPVIIIAVVFTGLAAVMFWAAPRGKLAPLTNTILSQKKGTSAVINGVIVLIIVAFGFVIPGIMLVNNHDNGATAGITGGIKLTANEVTGRQIFGDHCAVCHTLSAASAVGKTGPNLDQLKPSYGLIMNTLRNGCLANPLPSQANQACLGQGVMDANIVQGTEAQDVAQFVSRVAGHGNGT